MDGEEVAQQQQQQPPPPSEVSPFLNTAVSSFDNFLNYSTGNDHESSMLLSSLPQQMSSPPSEHIDPAVYFPPDIDWVSLFANGTLSFEDDDRLQNPVAADPAAGLTSAATSSSVTRVGSMASPPAPGGDDDSRRITSSGTARTVRGGYGGVTVGKSRKSSIPPRFAFHTRSADDVLDDGYKWRKYGQKAVKNSKHPRSYYRCTYHTCNVKKQIQRLARDTNIVVTTYEGIHNHPCEKLMETLTPLIKQLQFLSRF